MTDAYNWAVSNWAGIVAAVVAVEVAARYIAKLTPTTKDDEFIAKVESALAVLGVDTTEAPASK